MARSISKSSLLSLLGIPATASARHRESLVSGLGGCMAILAVLTVSRAFVGGDGAALLVASMGASAVLLFAMPRGPLSQPWSVVGGHVVSALIGVTAARLLPAHPLAAPLAVGGAIAAMQSLRCVHPPGGATALSAVVGTPQVTAMGFEYVLTPVALNVAIILTAAVSFNALFGWRRYPALFAREAEPAPDRAE